MLLIRAMWWLMRGVDGVVMVSIASSVGYTRILKSPFTVKAPSGIAFADTYPLPKAMTKDDIAQLKTAFVDAVRRAKDVGVDFLQIHGAHGYLFHSELAL